MKVKDFLKKHWKMMLTLVCVVCVAILVFGGFYTKLVNIYYEKDFDIAPINEELDTIVLYPGDMVTQDFALTLEEITSIAVHIPGQQEREPLSAVNLKFSVYDANHTLIKEQIYEGKTLGNIFLIPLSFESAVQSGEYSLTLEVLKAETGEPVEEAYVEMSQGDVANNKFCTINGQVTDKSLALTQRNFSWSQDGFKDFALVVSIVITIAIVLIFVVLFVLKLDFHWCYLCVALLIGFLFMFVIPPYSTPDEPMHISTAMHISNQILGWETTSEEATYVARITEVSTGLSAYLSRDVYNSFMYNLSLPVTEETSVLADQTSSLTGMYSLYTIPAIGVTVGRLLSLNGVCTILMGTLFNMLCCVCMVTYAIKKIPFGKMVLAGVCLLPMSAQQISSFSYDNPLLWSTAIVMALGLRWCYAEEKAKKSEIILYLVSSMFLIIGKGGVYFMYILLPFIYKFSKEKGALIWSKYRKQTIFFVIGVAVVFLRNKFFGIIESILGTGEAAGGAVLTESSVQSGNYIAWAGAEGYTIMELLMNPLQLFKIIFNTMMTYMDWYLGTMLGGSLGWFDVSIPWYLLVICVVVLFLATIKPIKEQGEMQLIDKLIVDFFAVVSCGLCLAAMLILWTPKTTGVIQGVQGRYFLPPLMAFLLTLRTSKLQINRNIDKELLYTIFMVDVLVVFYVLYTFVLV